LAQGQFGLEPNILGLPAVPQPKPGASAPASPGAPGQAAGKAAPAGAQPLPATDPRSFLTGQMSIQHSVIDGVGRVVATSQGSYPTPEDRQQVLKAGVAMQAGLKDACGKQCQPMPMPKPEILPSGQVQVQFVFKPIYSHLSNEQMVALMQGKPMQLSDAQRKAPAAVPPTVKVEVSTPSANVTTTRSN
jgi:hypothetical protein